MNLDCLESGAGMHRYAPTESHSLDSSRGLSVYRCLAIAVVAAATALPGWAPAAAQPASPTQTPAPIAAPAKKPAKGALRIRITGLPTGVRPAVRITGPGRYRKTVKRTAPCGELNPGVYQVRHPAGLHTEPAQPPGCRRNGG